MLYIKQYNNTVGKSYFYLTLTTVIQMWSGILITACHYCVTYFILVFLRYSPPTCTYLSHPWRTEYFLGWHTANRRSERQWNFWIKFEPLLPTATNSINFKHWSNAKAQTLTELPRFRFPSLILRVGTLLVLFLLLPPAVPLFFPLRPRFFFIFSSLSSSSSSSRPAMSDSTWHKKIYKLRSWKKSINKT